MTAYGLLLNILLTLLLTAAAETAQASSSTDTSRGILVKFRTGVRSAKITSTHLSAKGIEKKHFRLSGVRLVTPAQGSSGKETLQAYKNNPDVLFAVPNRVIRKATSPNDPYFPAQWGLYNTGQTSSSYYGTYNGTPGADIAVRTAWETTTGSSSIIAATLDTGIDLHHPDLAGNIWLNSGETSCDDGIDNDGNGYIDDCHGWNFALGNNSVLDDDADYHGTHVAGIIAAGGNNGIGISGIAPKARIMPLKILDNAGYGDMAGIVAAVEYAIKNGAGIINASYTYPQFCEVTEADPAELEVLKTAEKAGLLVVAAAGNYACNNDKLPFYPASHRLPNIISVGASTPLDSYAIFSNRGSNSVHIAAPGVNILSTISSSATGLYSGLAGYELLSGTSMAAPAVTGIAALVKAAHPQYNYLQTREAILLGAAPKSFAVASGGRANAVNALTLNLAMSPPFQPSGLALRKIPDGSIELSWVVNSSNEEGFIVERSIGNGNFLHLATLPLRTAAYIDSALPQGEQLATYRVKAFNGIGNSPYSADLKLLTVLASPTNLTVEAVTGADVKLSWINNSTALDGFKIERKQGDTGEYFQIGTTDSNTTVYFDTGLSSGVFTYRVRAYIANSSTSEYSNEVTASIGGSGGGGCFIATAAYGSYLHPKVKILREFRDNYLLTNRPGRAFVNLYYRFSPAAAAAISGNSALRLAARTLLTPLVILIEYPTLVTMSGFTLLLIRRRNRLKSGNAIAGDLLKSCCSSPHNERH